METNNKPPLKNTYSLIPKLRPEISDSIKNLNWDSVEQKLHIKVEETSKLDTIQWMDGIHCIQKKLKEGPFVDLNEDVLTLKITNGDGVEIGNIEFKNISIEQHVCKFNESKNPLSHELVIGYKESKRLPPAPIDSATLDKEWKA